MTQCTNIVNYAWLLLATITSINAYADTARTHNRIITAGGSITELFYALDLGAQVIAVDTSSLYPPQSITLPKVGYFRSLTTEGLMSLNPDMLIAARGAGPDIVLEQIDNLGVEVKTYEQSEYNLTSWKSLVRTIGTDFGKTTEATLLVSKVSNNITQIQQDRHFDVGKVNAIALLSIGQRGPIAAGKNTVPDLLMQLAGITNVAQSLEGYQPFSTELLAEQRVDIILIPSHIASSLGGEETICANQTVKLATSGECQLFVMDGLLLMGFGARIDQAVAEIVRFANQL